VEIIEEFTVARPVEAVWKLFLDVADVGRCFPGAEVTEDHGDGTYSGLVAVKLGPISSSFDGKAEVTTDEETREIQIRGRGVDRTGGSQGRVEVLVALADNEDGQTDVSIVSQVTLAGPIAQFGRTGLVKEVSRRLIDEFADCVHAKLEAGSHHEAMEIGADQLAGLSLFFSSVWAWVTSRFRRQRNGDE
jgi:carbon monoxide dehydrogenase subunit G